MSPDIKKTWPIVSITYFSKENIRLDMFWKYMKLKKQVLRLKMLDIIFIYDLLSKTIR